MPPASAYPRPDLSPEEFEREVRKIFDAMGVAVESYQSNHRAIVPGVDGDYEIDVELRFSVFGIEYLTLVECKRHSVSIKREDVQVLWTKVQSTGAQKGVVIATSDFQSGALEFAKVHGIALITIADGRTSYLTRVAPSGAGPVSWNNVPDYVPKIVGWLREGTMHSLISERDARELARSLGFSS